MLTIPRTHLSNIHGRLLPYGIINWATKGIFLGQRHLYFAPQPDDMLSFGDRWDAITHTTIFDQGFRLDPADIDNLLAWMDTFTTTMPNASDFKIEMPFNGEGVEYDTIGWQGTSISQHLTAKVMANEDHFVWLNHTWSHPDLYTATYQLAYDDIYSNTVTAHDLGFTDWTSGTLLTGAYSGLTNTQVISAAFDVGVRYMESNASQPGFNNPSPNTGIYTGTGGAMLLVPRLANNVFYFATTREEEVDYYNLVYDVINNKPYCAPYYDSAHQDPPDYNQGLLCYNYNQILDMVTNQALGFLLDFNVDATMFHMNNLNQYSGGTNTLMGDYVTALYSKYNTYYNTDVPVLSPRTQEIGDLMQQRMDYNDSDVSGIIACANQITLTIPTTATTGARVPVTGVSYGSDKETYAGQDISYVEMGIDETVVIPGTGSPSTPSGVDNLAIATSPTTRTLTWDATAGAYGYRVYRSDTSPFTPGPSNELGVVMTTSFLDDSGNPAGYYAVTAIADDCWKHESAASFVNIPPTALTLVGISATSGSFVLVGLVPLAAVALVALVVVWGKRRHQVR